MIKECLNTYVMIKSNSKIATTKRNACNNNEELLYPQFE